MTNPYTGPNAHPYPMPPAPQSARPAPRWARKRYVLPALGLAWFIGVGIGASGDTTADAKPAAAKPRPAVTVTATTTATATATATPLAKKPEPAPTVTATKTVRATTTVTARPAAGGGSDDSGSGGSGGSADVSYANCDAVRAAGAAPIHRGEPGYASHLDRDNDGIACDT
ncbi:excalibur calcium-binding domain-containing protein [Streptomyces afghaniensis]|uniref:excalibur calcium-binding domain-containing protein n=1 Tax=Streptomyces afghaniensis TaxID=66865 RepID=UPI00358DFDD7